VPGVSKKKKDFWLLMGAILSEFEIGAFGPKSAPSVKVTRVARGDARRPRALHTEERTKICTQERNQVCTH